MTDKKQEVGCIGYLLAEKNVLLSQVETTGAEDLSDGQIKKKRLNVSLMILQKQE